MHIWQCLKVLPVLSLKVFCTVTFMRWLALFCRISFTVFEFFLVFSNECYDDWKEAIQVAECNHISFFTIFCFSENKFKMYFFLNKNVLKVNFERLHWQKHKINIFSSLETNAALFFTLEKNKSSETKWKE